MFDVWTSLTEIRKRYNVNILSSPKLNVNGPYNVIFGVLMQTPERDHSSLIGSRESDTLLEITLVLMPSRSLNFKPLPG